MTMYQVQATITRTVTQVDGTSASRTRQIPTFYLDSRVQGILTLEGAYRLAGDMLSAAAGEATLGVSITIETSVMEV